ncbi:MAG: hypothetical protein R3E68_21455 [Burkholderiaceae bacterium]
MVGIYLGNSGEAFPGSYLALIVAALLVAVIVGPILEKRPAALLLRSRRSATVVLVTYGIFLVLEDLMKIIWGSIYYVFEPYTLLGNVSLGPLYYVDLHFAVIAAIIVGLIVWGGLNRTRIGKVVLAVIHDSEISGAMGVNIRRIYMGAFIAGVFLAALGGALTAPMISVTPGLGSM